MRLTRRLAPGMAQRGRGCVISLGSVAGRKGVADEGAYAGERLGL